MCVLLSDAGDDGLFDTPIAEGASVEQLLSSVGKLREEKRELHDRLRAAELDAVHLRRKLEEAHRKLAAASSRKKAKGAPPKPKPKQ